MNSWGSWKFNEKHLSEIEQICQPLYAKNESNDWLQLKKYNTLKLNTSDHKVAEHVADVEMPLKISSQDECSTINFILETIETFGNLEQNQLTEIPTYSLEKVLSQVSQKLSEQGFSHFCKIMCSWKNSVLLGMSFQKVILPKLQEKKESSVYTATSIKELAKNMPDKVCSNLLIPLITAPEETFSDTDLLCSIFEILPDNEKDSLVGLLLGKDNFSEDDWLLLQPLVPHVTVNSFSKICNSMNDLCEKYASSQVFAKFLVTMCKNVPQGANKIPLYNVAEKNSSLLKRQALKFLEAS